MTAAPQSAAASSQATDRDPRSESSPERGKFSVVFRDLGDWAALNACREFLAARDFSAGETQVGAPIAVMHGEVKIGKYRTLSPEDLEFIHGRIDGDLRAGPVTVTIRGDAPVAAIEAFRSDPPDLCAQMHIEGRA